jgi:small subunit ribosomal protein S8e
MVIIHGKSKKKQTGGRFTNSQPKRLHQKGSAPVQTRIADVHKKTTPTKGGGMKVKVIASNKVNLYDPKTKKYSMESIKNVAENSADRHFVRHNILTKGAVIMTSKGKARVTNRPAQEGTVNATLVE